MAIQTPVQIGGSNGGSIVLSEWFVARITGVDTTSSGSGACSGFAHSWIEQRVCRNGIGYEDAVAESAETGTFTDSPAFPINGINASTNDFVLMRIRGINATGITIYEFMHGAGGGGGTGYVTSVQCTSGLLTVTYDS
jgi:hypothetical protein